MNIARNTKRRYTRQGASRDLGLGHGAGKGDAPRSNFSEEFHRNFQNIHGEQLAMFGWGRASEDPKFVQVKPGRYRRTF